MSSDNFSPEVFDGFTRTVFPDLAMSGHVLMVNKLLCSEFLLSCVLTVFVSTKASVFFSLELLERVLRVASSVRAVPSTPSSDDLFATSSATT